MKWLKFFSGVKTIETKKVKKIIKKTKESDKYFLLDVREPSEHTKNSIKEFNLIPLFEIWKRSDEIPGNKTILVLCRSGNRSKLASRFLAVKGFTDVYNISGGIIGLQ